MDLSPHPTFQMFVKIGNQYKAIKAVKLVPPTPPQPAGTMLVKTATMGARELPVGATEGTAAYVLLEFMDGPPMRCKDPQEIARILAECERLTVHTVK